MRFVDIIRKRILTSYTLTPRYITLLGICSHQNDKKKYRIRTNLNASRMLANSVAVFFDWIIIL